MSEVVLPPRYAADVGGTNPPLSFEGYRSTALRYPKQPMTLLPQQLTELTGPLFGADRVQPGDDDLTHWDDGEAVGQRIIVHGRVLDSDGRAVPDALLEVWQANAGGRYRHDTDQWPSPLDPHFAGWAAPSPTPTVTTGSPRSSPAPTRGRTTTMPGARRTSTSRCSGVRSRSAS